MGVVYNPDRNTLIPISTVSGEITYLTAGLIYEKMRTCLIIGTEVTYLKHYPDQDLYIADKSYIGVNYNCIFSNRAQRDPYSYFHRWNPNTQEFVIRTGVSLNLSNVTKNGIMYFYFPNDNAYTILSYDYNRLFFNNVEEIKATVRVNYYLPDYDYTYAKITYKKDDKPASETDGTSVEILKDQSSVDISGLEVGGNYWFTVFTDKSESEAFPFLIPELIDYGNMIFNDNSEITVVNNNSSTTAITTPKFLVDTYKEKSTQSGYSYMNTNANTWLIGPANKTTGYYHIFGWTLPTDKDIYIICQNNTGQNAYYVWIWWDGLTSRDMLGTNCGYSKWFVVSSSVIYYESGTALNNYSSFNNNLIVNNNRYWSQTGLGGDSSLKPIVWTELNTSRIWVNGQKLT